MKGPFQKGFRFASIRKHNVDAAVPQAIQQMHSHKTKLKLDDSPSRIDFISMLPEHIVDSILCYLQVSEVDNSVQYVCRSFRYASNSIPLWKEFCFRTGKILHQEFAPPSTARQESVNTNQFTASLQKSFQFPSVSPPSIDVSPIIATKCKSSVFASFDQDDKKGSDDNAYRQFYYRNPCVPVDIETIQKAVDYCPSGGTITILPGLYFERIHCVNKHQITIRAAFPHIGAALIHHHQCSERDESQHSHSINEPCILISGCSSNVTICYLQTLHFSPGIDLWSGNCVVLCDDSAALHLHQCSFQSDSGRGIVVTGGSRLVLSHCVVHDCAATGLYVGDIGTSGVIYQSTIIENGFGSDRSIFRSRRRPVFEHHYQDDEDDWTSEEEDSFSDNVEIEERVERLRVPPGHSGVYVETAQANIHDCMISGNSLTGLSVVRRGCVQISGSDVTENGTVPMSVEEIPTLDAPRNNNFLEGGIFCGPEKNNFTSSIGHERGKPADESPYALGGRIRYSIFFDTIHHPLTISKLKQKYMKEKLKNNCFRIA